MAGTAQWNGTYDVRLDPTGDGLRVEVLRNGVTIKVFEDLSPRAAGRVVADFVVADVGTQVRQE